MKHHLLKLTGLSLLFFSLTGCWGGSDPEVLEVDTLTPDFASEQALLEPEDPLNPFEGMAKNPRTGAWVSEELATRQPFAVVINNLPRALPQSGISEADIMYEVLAEGGITRLVGIFSHSEADAIGPVRSTRDYFAPMALEHDAIFVHHGGSPSGYQAVTNLGLRHIDGMRFEGTYLFRNQARLSQAGMFEHSSYTSQSHVHAFMTSHDIDIYNHTLAGEGHFDFFEERDSPLLAVAPVDEVVLPFSNLQRSSFVFDEEIGLFRRYQRNDPHMDEYTNEQVFVANVIIQQVAKNLIPGDAEGRMNVHLVGSGSGYLATNGTFKPITWEKASLTEPTIFRDLGGNRLTLNQGMTWIGVIQETADVQFNVLEADEEEV